MTPVTPTFRRNINAVGKVIFQEDASGWQTFKYGKLGEVTENIRTFALPFDNQAYTFIMKYEYDSWNRIQKMIYPDSEVVSYGYNLGGMLKSISGEKLGYVYHYIDSIQYNELEMKEALYYGNGTKTFYRYDVLQRLINLQSYTATTATPSELMQNIDYTYDAVSNITDIINSAGILANGLGGKYNNQYKYDNLYRLIYSTGNWDGIHPVQYKTVLGYLSNGRIEKKYTDAQIYQQTVYSNSVSNVFYDNSYHYNTTGQKNTLSYIDGGPYQEFEWDAKGNMTYHKHDGIPMKRYLCWDEQNRLLGVMDNSNLSFYLYDANDDRTYKYTGYYTWQNQSGQWHYFYQMNNATLYASPYFVATKQGYTKHYYAESERICSKIGGGGLTDIDSLIVTQDDFVNKYASLKHHIGQVAECLNAPDYDRNAILNELYHWKYLQEDQEDKRYFYHPDHLGSSSWITYSDGKAVQHLHYLPWGENFVDQRTSSFSSMFTFSAKEKDAETGYSYFGSRYYNSDLSIWLSVDPMSDKYPNMSPYIYCANNPVKLVDPDGEDYVVVVEGNTITIKAKYYVTKDTRKGVEEAIRNFKEQAPYLSYTSQKGKTYSIKFDLTIAGEFDTPEQAKQAKKDNGKCGYANYCVSGETLIPDGSDKPALGQTLKGTDITIRTDRVNDYRTFTHEIGHSLGFGHWMFGVMGDDLGDTQIMNEYIQQSMYRAGFANTQSLSTSLNFSTDDMWQYVGKGKVNDKTKKR